MQNYFLVKVVLAPCVDLYNLTSETYTNFDFAHGSKFAQSFLRKKIVQKVEKVKQIYCSYDSVGTGESVKSI
jgi:hypothetical protein